MGGLFSDDNPSWSHVVKRAFAAFMCLATPSVSAFDESAGGAMVMLVRRRTCFQAVVLIVLGDRRRNGLADVASECLA